MASPSLPLDLDSIPKLPCKAWVVIGGSEFDAHDISIIYSASQIPTANIALATGYTFAGAKVFDASKLNLFTEGTPGEVWVDFTGASPLPGLPRGPTKVFTGYISVVSPSISFESGSTFGVQLQHKAISDLGSGSTVQWGAMLSLGRPDPGAIIARMNAEQLGITGGDLAETGLIPLVTEIYRLFMDSATIKAETGAKFAACTGTEDLNIVARAALDALTGSDLKLREDIKNSYSVFSFIKTRIGSDLWTMSVAEQLQTLGQDLMFRVVPHADGTVEIVPLTAFGKEFATLDGEHIFAFAPSYAPNRRIAGVVLVNRPPNGASSAADATAGCYVFPISTVRAGVVIPVDLPPWLSISVADLQRSKEGNATVWDPPSMGNDVGSADITPEGAADTAAAANTYGNFLAREIARKTRYEGCTAHAVTHFRTDIGVLSTLRVDAPLAIDQDATVYGRVDTLTLTISAQSGTALATYGLAYVRSQQTQELILADGGDEHPLYQDVWAGSAL